MLDRSGYALLILVVFALAFGSGAELLRVGPADDQPAPEAVVEETVTEYPSSVEGRLYMVIERNETEIERRNYDLIDRPGRAERRVTIVDDDGNETTIVENETDIWSYDEETGEILHVDRDEQRIVVPALEFDGYEHLVDEFDATYIGTERVSGREAHVIEFTPPRGEEDSVSLDLVIGETELQLARATIDGPLVVSEYRIWVDTEHAHPLKERTTLSGPEGESITLTNRYDHVAFETDPDEDTFEFDPPSDAEVREPPSFEEYESVEAAADVVPYPIPDPDPPDGYEIRTVSVRPTEDDVAVFVVYSDGTDSLTVSVTPQHGSDPVGVRVDLDGRVGTVVETHGGTAVVWECNDRAYRVAGTGPTEERIAVAKAIECGRGR